MSKKLRVGLIGMGVMGRIHLTGYLGNSACEIVAIADNDPAKLESARAFFPDSPDEFADGLRLIKEADVDAVDICLHTPQHFSHAKAAIDRGLHVLLEKPVSRTSERAWQLASMAGKQGVVIMPAVCTRFWPGWNWLKETIDSGRFGKVLSASFRRFTSHPGGEFFTDGEACGGALLDLHMHETDFVNWCFGVPAAVTSFGYARHTSRPDHVVTQYDYPDVPMVMAESAWTLAPGFGFRMQYLVNFENATVTYDSENDKPLVITEANSEPRAEPVASELGYELEVRYFVDCAVHGRSPILAPLVDGAVALEIIAAEGRSIAERKRVDVVISRG